MPATSIHIVLHFLLIIMVYCWGCIIKSSNHICLDIGYFRICIMHTPNHILQMSTVQLQEFWLYKLIGIILSCNPDCCTFYTYNLTNSLKKFLIQSLVLPVIVLHVMLIFDVLLNQFYVCIDIIHHISPIWIIFTTWLIDMIGIIYIIMSLVVIVSIVIIRDKIVYLLRFSFFTFRS